MIDKRVVFEIHRLAHEGWSKNRIAGQLALDRATVAKYLDNPNPERKKIIRPSLLDPFREQIREMLETHPHVSAAVTRRRPPRIALDRAARVGARLSGHSCICQLITYGKDSGSSPITNKAA
jgi:hypothetical protein